jgi:hypothetical protein
MKNFKKWMVVPFVEEKSNSSIISDDRIDKLQKLDILKRKLISLNDPIIKEELIDNDFNNSTVSKMDNLIVNNDIIDKSLNNTINDSLNSSINNESILNNNVFDDTMYDDEKDDQHNNSTFQRGPGQGTRAQRASRLQNEIKNKRKLEKTINTESPIKKKRVAFTPPNPKQIEDLMDDIQTITKKKLVVKNRKKRLIKKPTVPDWVQTRLTRFINESKKKKNKKIKS